MIRLFFRTAIIAAALFSSQSSLMADDTVIDVKMTYVNYDAQDKSYGWLPYGAVAMTGNNTVSDGSLSMAHTKWKESFLTIISVDASSLPSGCSLKSVSLSADLSGGNGRQLTYGIGYSDTVYTEAPTYNNTHFNITTVGSTVTPEATNRETFASDTFDVTGAFSNDSDKKVTLLLYATGKATAGCVKNPSLTVVYTTGDNTETTATGSISKSLTVEKTYTTFCSTESFDFSDETNVTPYAAKVSDGSVVLTKLTVVPAGWGVILYAPGDNKSLTLSPTTETADISGNELVGVQTLTSFSSSSESDSDYYYMLSDGIFYHFATDNDGTVYMQPNKAYLKSATNVTDEEAKGMPLVFADDNTTGITEVTERSGRMSEARSNTLYNINGIRVVNARKGLYIINNAGARRERSQAYLNSAEPNPGFVEGNKKVIIK